METIVQQIVLELGNNLCKKVEKEGLSNIDQFATEALELCKGSVRDLISQILQQLNEDLRRDKAFRKEQGLVLKEKDRKRSLLTEVGEIHFNRDYYQINGSNEYVHPLDFMVGITAYERVSANVSARLVTQAAEVSYEKSAKVVTKGEVSKQTVKNKLLAVGRLEKEAPSEKRTVRELHVFADEDHVHLQKGRNRMVPLITVSEGIKTIHKGRNALVNQTHFTGTIKSTQEAWNKVAGYIAQAYEECEIEKTYLHGDGAFWIKQGLDELPNCKFVIDGFHFEKHLKRATAAFPNGNYRFRIRQAVMEKDREKVVFLVNEMLSLSEEPKQGKRIREFRRYVVNNWEGIVRRYTENLLGSCTEGLVSHVYSERLSRNPMGWSDTGLAKMAELRVYTRNGGMVSGETFKRPNEEKNRSVLTEYGKERIKSGIGGHLNWDIFEKEPYLPASNEATQILIRSYGRQRSLVG